MKVSSQGWREFGERRSYYRSRWEANYGRYLEFLRAKGLIFEWVHEPKTFWFEGIKRGVVSYKPDFQVFSSEDQWHWVEVKGYYDARSLTKIKRMGKYHPTERLVLIDSKWFKSNNAKMKLIVPAWESK